jgi:hypothetical protein
MAFFGASPDRPASEQIFFGPSFRRFFPDFVAAGEIDPKSVLAG